MLKLIEELLERGWQFSVLYDDYDSEGGYHLEMVLGNQYREVYTDNEAEGLLQEIKMHW